MLQIIDLCKSVEC